MNITCAPQDLSAALKIVGPAVNHSPAVLPVLGNVLLSTLGNGALAVSASNLEIGIRTRIQAGVIDRGEITVPALALTNLVALLTGDVTLGIPDEVATLRLVSGRTKANIKGIPAQEFPFIPDYADLKFRAGLPTLTLAPAGLERALDRTVFAAATDDSRPILTGVYLHAQESGLTFAAVDGTRLSVQTTLCPAADFPSLIIPAPALREVSRLLANETEPVLLVVNGAGTQAAFLFSDTQLVTQLIPGNFPDYSAIIPSGHTATITVSPTALRRALQGALVFSGGDAARLTTWIVGEDSLTITGSDAETGDMATPIPATVEAAGEPVANLLLNGRYVLDLLQAIGNDTDRVEICLTTPTSPILFRLPGDDFYAHVIMPQTR